jgi:integrase
MLILYGLRRGEALGLQWDNIDFDAGTIQIHRHRTGRPVEPRNLVGSFRRICDATRSG